ncbi:MAG: thiamine pyrophosphate-binding protein [Candidatus Geothermincolales bacterium]
MDCAHVVAEALVAMGVPRVYGVCGTSNVAFLDALYDYRDLVRYISCRHEQVAASMADAEGRLTGRPGVALTHSGPGTLNALISVANAHKDCSPMILISGAVKRKLRGTDGMLEADHPGIFRSLCRAVLRIDRAEDAVGVMEEAYRRAVSGPRGPVLVEVPEDVWKEEAGEGVSFSFAREEPPPCPPELVDAVARRAKDASRPVILAGGGVAASGASSLLEELARRLWAPVITTGNGRGVVPEDHPLCLGRVGFGGGNTAADAALSEADLVLGVGCTLSDAVTYEYTLPVRGEVILVNVDPEAAKRSLYPVSTVVQADAGEFLRACLEQLGGWSPPARDEWWGFLEGKRKEWKDLLRTSSCSDRVPLSGGRVVSELARLLPPRRVITAGMGTHVLYAIDFLPCLEPFSYLSAANFGAMGFGMPAAMAAALVYPDRPVVAILGDGEFMMTLQDLETACREKIPVKILVMNDCMYRVLNLRQRLQFGGRVLGTCHGNPDFAVLARSFGAEGHTLREPGEIVPVLERMLASPNPVVVDVIIDPDDLPPTDLEATLRMSQG